MLVAAGHGEAWARVFHAVPQDSERIWAAIAAAVVHAPISVVRDCAARRGLRQVAATCAAGSKAA